VADLQALGPSIWPLEAANATIVGERGGRLDEARSQRFFQFTRRGLPRATTLLGPG
jgi:hypothetical protein